MELRKNLNYMQKKVFIKTFGCQMNEYDSNRIADTIKKILKSLSFIFFYSIKF